MSVSNSIIKIYTVINIRVTYYYEKVQFEQFLIAL